MTSITTVAYINDIKITLKSHFFRKNFITLSFIYATVVMNVIRFPVNLAEYYYVRQLLSIFLFILYTGSNSEDPDEMQHKVAFYQDLHCHLQGLKNIILYILHIYSTPYNTYSE